MSLFDRFKADRVACDELLVLQDIEMAVPIQLPLPEGSCIDPQGTRVEVVISECDLKVDVTGDRFFMDLDLFIIKDILINRPGLPPLPLEFSFIKRFPDQVVTGCRPSEIPPDILRRLRCQIFDLQAQDTLSLNPTAGTFDEILIITVTVKIVFEDQIPIPTAPPPTVAPTVPPTTTAPIVSPTLVPIFCPTVAPTVAPVVALGISEELEIVAGKIRAQIANQCLKRRLLADIARAQCLIQIGRLVEALAILSAIVDELQFLLNSSPARRCGVNLVLGDLIIARQQLTTLMAQLLAC